MIDQVIFSRLIILLHVIFITLISLDGVWILLGENLSWSLFWDLKGQTIMPCYLIEYQVREKKTENTCL